MRTLQKIVLILISFIFISANAQTISPQQQKLENAIKLLKEYKTDEAEKEFKQINDDETLKKFPKTYIRAELNLGRISGDRGNNVVAMQHYQNAMKIAEKIDDKEAVPHILKNIGVLYVSWKRFNEAMNYYSKAEILAKANNNEELVADCENNKGIIYEQKEDYSKALLSYKTALELYTTKKNTGKIAMSLSNIAIVYKYKKDYPQSLIYNFKAIKLAEEQDDKWSIAATYNNIGNLYGEMGDYKNAILYCKKALILAKEINAVEITESTYDSMAEAAAKAGDYKNAFEYHKQFSETLNSFNNTENNRQLSELNIKYETEKKQNLINQQKFEIKQKNNLLLFSTVAFLLAMITGFFIYLNFKHKQDKKLQQEIFRQQELETKALFEGEQKERIRIARDIHDSIGQMLSIIKMNLSSQEKNHENEKIQNLVDKTIDETRNISHNLIPEELNFGIFPALESLADKVNSSETTKMKIYISEDTRGLKFQKQNELSIYRIAQEVLNNMMKHANATLIILGIEKIENTLKISIKDNGTGMNTNEIKNSKGIGWKNINARINMMDGKIKINSEKLAGTHIEITLPQNEE